MDKVRFRESHWVLQMIFRGTIQGGKVLIKGRIDLPDGTLVEVRPIKATQRTQTRKAEIGLKRLTRYVVSTGIRDLSEQHDHYVYGTSRRVGRKKR